MSEQTPSDHSMTVKPIEHVEDIAAELFKLRQWKAEAVQTISQLESERDEARAEAEAARKEIARLGVMVDALAAERDEAKRNLDGLLVAGFNTPPGECTNCAEMRGTLDELRAALQVHTDAHRQAATELSTLRANDAQRRSELAHLTKQLHEVATDRDRNLQQRNELQHQLNICREDLAAADRTVRVTKAALDAAIEAI